MKCLTLLKKYLVLKNKFCPVCERRTIFNPLPNYYNQMWEKYGFIHSVENFEMLNYREYSCFFCNATDRDRLIALYFNKFVSKKEKINLLDIAPSTSLQMFIKKNFKNILYRSADLILSNVDDNVDIENMYIYADNTFDMFICSHVLEHVDNDVNALKELYRILKKDGIGLILVPILMHIKKDYEVKNVMTDEQRWRYYGQGDHYRLYSKQGFLEKLTMVGFKVKQFTYDNWSKEIFYKHAIELKSVLYIVLK